MEFYENLWQIEKNPYVAFGGKSVRALYGYIVGYGIARTELKVEKDRDEQHFYFFGEWLHKRLNVSTASFWSELLLEHSESDEQAFDLFFVYLKEYTKSRD